MRFMTSRAAEPMGKCRKGAGGEVGASRPPAGSRIISAMHTVSFGKLFTFGNRLVQCTGRWPANLTSITGVDTPAASSPKTHASMMPSNHEKSGGGCTCPEPGDV